MPKKQRRATPTALRPTPDSSTWRWFLAVAATGFVLRLVYLFQIRANDPLFASPQMDALYHHQWALAIAAGREFISDAFFRAPLYPYFLGLVYKLLGSNPFTARLVQILLGSASCGLVYLLALRLLGKPELRPLALPSLARGEGKSATVARFSGLVMAAYPLAIYYDGELLISGLLMFLLLLGCVLLLRSRDLDRQWYLPGFVFGLTAIARPNVLAFLAVIPVWLFLEYRRTAWKRMGILWAAAALVILPVTVRNFVVSRQFVPIAWQAGTNFYIGNNPNSDGVTAILPGTRASWWGGYNDVKRLAEQALGRELKGAEIDRYWLARGFEFWQKQPGKALGLLGRKAYLWFAGYEVSNDREIYFVKQYSFLKALVFNGPLFKFPLGLLLPLALAGAWLLRRQWRRFLPLYLFAGSYSLSFIVFFVTARYRMPLVPIVLVLAVAAVFELARLPGRSFAGPATIVAAAYVILNLNTAGAGRLADPAQNLFASAVGLHKQGRSLEALGQVQAALRYDSAPNILDLEATILAEQGQIQRAEMAAQAVVRLAPDEADSYGTLGNVLATAGMLDSAKACFEKALALDPYALEAWNNLGNIALSRSDFTTARRYYEGALKINPNFTTSLFHLGLLEYYQGNKERAHALWQQVLKLDPGYAKARQALEQLR